MYTSAWSLFVQAPYFTGVEGLQKLQDGSGRGYYIAPKSARPLRTLNPTSSSGPGQDTRPGARHQARDKTSGQGQDEAPSFSGPVITGMAQTDDDRRTDSVVGVSTATCQSVRQHGSRGRNERQTKTQMKDDTVRCLHCQLS